METSEASADDKLSTIVEYLPPVPEAYAFEEQVGSPVYPLDGVTGPPINDFDLGEAEIFESADVPPEVNGFFPAEEPGIGSAAVASPPPDLKPSTSAPALSEPDFNQTSVDVFEELKPTKRSLRAKTRKRIYQEENSEGELPSEDEESLFPRVSSHYYSDDEYVPSKKSKKKESDEYETEEEEEDEEIVEDLPRRKRRRKKPGEQNTPVKSPKKPAATKKGRGKQAKKDRLLSETTSDDQALSGLNGSVTSDQITVQPVTLDSDSDIENCLQMSKIKVTENLKLKLEASAESKPNGQPEPTTEDSAKPEISDSIETKITESKKPEIVTPKESKKAILKEPKNSTPKEPKKPVSKKKSPAESKKKSETDSEMGKVFENFLTTKTELQIKKVNKKSVSNASPLEIPTIEPPELIKLMDSWTQTEMKEMRSSLMQTSSPYAMRINKTVTLNQQQAENACTLMKKVLTMTTELGTLMCEKSEEFIKKKITPEYIKDTTKVAFCKEKTALLFKLAKDNLTKIEEMLEKNYEEYINNNDLTSAVEVDKRITPKMPEEDNSDCEIVEVTKQEPTKKELKKKVGPSNTVFLNKELSIKIAKKPQEATKTTPQGRQIKVSGRHAVWINKSIMVKKVNTNQSFLAQDRRFDKPPDKVIEEIVQNFFENFKVKMCCEPYTSTEWLVPGVNVEVVCNYFVVADLDKRPSAITTGSGSEDDGFFEGPAGEENVTELNNQYDVVGEPELKPAQSQPHQRRREPESLITLCVRYLHNLLYKPNNGESDDNTHPEQNLEPTTAKALKPNHLLHLCVKELEKRFIICENSQTNIRKENNENFSKYSANMHCHPSISIVNTEVPSSEVGTTKSPAKLSLICLHVFCKLSKTTMSLNGVSRSLYSNGKKSSMPVTKHEVVSISLKKLCYEKIVSMLYKNEVLLDKISDNGNEDILDSGICYAEQNDTEAQSDISLTLSQYENDWSDDMSSINVKSLKVLCTETVNAILYSASDKLLRIPAITDIRQINNFNSFIDSDEGSVGGDDEYPDDDDSCEPAKSNWVAQIRVKDLKSFILQASSSQGDEGSNILEGITLKLEPIDQEENVQEEEHQEEERVHNLARIKQEKETSANDSFREHTLANNNMVIVPNVNMIPKTERTNEAADPLFNNLTEDFMDDSFQEILRRNKLSIQGDHTPPSRESPVDIFTQRHNRRRRQFEPDSDHENDAMELLIPQSFRDFNVQPSNKAKGTLLESSSDNEDKNDAPTRKKRGRRKKNKHEIKNKNKEKEAPPSAPVNKEKVPNEIEILTRRMKEKIRNEEKQKESSSDSENEVLYSLKANITPSENVNNVDSSKPEECDKKNLRSRQIIFENLDKSETEKTDTSLDKKSLKNKPIEERRLLRNRKQVEPADNKPTELERNTNKKEQSPEFPGFSVETSNASEMASLRSYMQYIKDKGFPGEDVAPDPSKDLNKNGSKDFQNDYNDDDHFNDVGFSDDDIDKSEEQIASDLPLQKKTNSTEEFDAMVMLTPQCEMVIDEHSKVDLGAIEPKKRGRKKKTKDPKPDGNETKQDSNAAVENNLEKKQNTVETQQNNIESNQLHTEVISQVESPPVISPKSNSNDQPVTVLQEVKKEPEDYTLRDGWKCHKISQEDVKLYQLCYVPMDKLPESFVQTYFQFVQLSRSQEEDDPEIERLTNIKSLHRAPQKEDGIKRHKPGPKSRTQAYHIGDTNDANANDSREYEELEPSDDDHDADKEEPSGEGQIKIKTENTLAKSSLMDGASSGSDNEDKPLIERKKSKQKKAEAAAVTDPKSFVLTADKVMKKELDLLHAPVVIDGVRPYNKPQHHDKISPQKVHKTGTSNRGRRKSDSDASSEEEKQWITTKEKLLKRLEKKNRERLEIDDDKRARIVSDYIEKKAGEKNNAYAGALITQRRHLRVKRKSRKQKEKELRILQMELQKNMANNGGHFEMELPIHGKKGAQTSFFKGRRNIRKVIDKKSLARSTVIANMEEIERKRRLAAKQQQLCAHLGCDPSVKAIVINGELCLEYDFEENRPTVAVHQAFTSVMKAHQCEGVKFMWDASFETLERVMYGHPGGGCILAHCMGLGKTLQVLALIHTVMTHKSVGVKRVLVCCPLSTVLNWVDEIHKWMGPVTNKIKVFELSKLKKTYERAYQLEEWYNIGGIFIVGYELFRTLTNLHPLVDDIRSTIIDKINTALIDPGPDIVVCDEGHLLKNDCSGLAVAMSRVKTRRRIVLTGTPMQNNLREYYCMVNFVKPNLLGTYSEFSNRFENPVMNGQHRDSSEDDIRLMKFRSHILHKVLEGCLQRQEASVLYPYLPKKYEYTVFISLTKCQSEMYKHYLANYANKNKQNVLKDFHILQKIWTHPQVLHNFQLKVRDDVAVKDEVKMEDDLGKEELGSEEIKNAGRGGEVWWTQYLEESEMLDALHTSNKLEAVFSILNECTRVGDKLLIFSTSLLTMDSLEYFLRTINKWSLGREYYRLDGSVPPEVRQKWCREFNAEHNTNTKLFLISTRAGCLGLNMTAANRVIILDTSWNPAHDIQSIFRVYRFGQRKDCYIYRLVTMGTMEQKIYERSVTKQAVACRVVDEQQIDRHYNMAELTELYSFEETDSTVAPIITAGDALLLSVVRKLPSAVRAVHEHDSLLRDSCDQQLPEHERAAAWAQFQMEQEHTEKQSLAGSNKRRKKGPVPVQQAVQIPILTQYPEGHQPLPSSSTLPAIPASFPSPYHPTYPPPYPPPPYPPPPYDPVQHAQPIGRVPESPSKRNVVKPKRYRIDSDSSTDSAQADTTNDPDWDEQDEKRPLASYQPRQTVYQPIRSAPKVVTIDKESAPVRVYSGSGNRPSSSRSDDAIVLSDSEQDPPQRPTPKSKIEVGKRILFKTKPPPLAASSRPVPTEDKSKVALHPSLLTNPYFLKIVAHTYRSWNPNLEDEAAMAAAQYSATMLMKKDGEIQSGTLYDIAVKTLGTQTMEVLWKNAQKENASGPSPKSGPSKPGENNPNMPTLSVAPGQVPTTTPRKGPTIIRPAKPFPIRPAQPLKAVKPMEPSMSTPEVESKPTRSGPLPKLRVKMQESLMKQPIYHPEPVSLHTGAHPSTMPMDMLRSTVELSDGEEESILPDDDTPRIGNASPPPPSIPPPPPVIPPPPPDAPSISVPPLVPFARTARKKTTQGLPASKPKDSYDVITLPKGQSPTGPIQEIPGQAPKRYTILRKQPTHIMGPNNTITPLTDAPVSQSVQTLMSTSLSGPIDTTICLDSDDDDISPTPDSSTNRGPTNGAPPLILNLNAFSQSNQPTIVGGPQRTQMSPIMNSPMPVPTGPILTAQQMQEMQKTGQMPQNLVSPQNISSQMLTKVTPPNAAQMPITSITNISQLPLNLQSIIQSGKRMGNIILVPANAFKGTNLEGASSLAVVASASSVPQEATTSAQSTLPHLAPKAASRLVVPSAPIDLDEYETTSLVESSPASEPVPVSSAVPSKRGRGRPRVRLDEHERTPVVEPTPTSEPVPVSSTVPIKRGRGRPRIDLDELETIPLVEPAPTSEPVPVPGAVHIKRGRGRPRGGKGGINPGEKLVYTRSAGFVVVKPGQTYEDAMNNSQNNPINQAAVTVPKQPIPIQPAKPHTQVKETDSVQKTQNQVQEPTSTTADEPTSSVDLTEEATRGKRKRRISSTSSSSSSSSSASSRASSPDTPLSIFQNVVQIQAPTINLDDEPDRSRSKTKPRLSLSKPGPSLSKLGSVLAKPTTNSVTIVKSTSEFSATKTGKSAVKPGTSKTYPGPNSAKSGLSSAKPGSSSAKPGSSSAKPGSSAAKPGSSSAKPGSSAAKPGSSAAKPTNKSSMVLKKIGNDNASWQQPKSLQKNKPGAKAMPTKDTVDLTDAPDRPNSAAKKKPERLLGMVDLTDLDEPEAKKPAISTEKSAEKTKTNIARASGVTTTQGAKNITLSNTGAITLTKPASSQESAKPKVTNVMNIKTDVKTTSPSKISVISEKRKAPPAPTAPSKKPKKAQPTSLEDFDIDDIMEDIIELE